jgi:hypothetical protein
MTEEISPEYFEKYRRAINQAPFVLMPDRRPFMVMWRWADQFGVRNNETGEQYSFRYEEAIRQGVSPLALAMIDIHAIQL